MKPLRLSGLIGIVLLVGVLSAQDGIQKGTIKKVEPTKRSLTITVDGKDLSLEVTATTKVMTTANQPSTDPFKNQIFTVGAAVLFKADQGVLIGIKLGVGKQTPPAPPKVDLAKLVPLNELGRKDYQGHKGGFYPDGENERPKVHEAAGLNLAKQVQPLNADGKHDPQGKIVFLSVGMSNTSQASQAFYKVLAAESDRNPQLVFVNGAVGGMTASRIQNPDNADGAKYWSTIDLRLKDVKLTRAQVQVIWIKEADAGPDEGFPGYAKKLEGELARIVQLLPKRYPNVKLVYLSSRTFGGYAKTLLNPEPYAYESGFSVKWLIERQFKGEADLNYDSAKGEVKAPWLSWGPYLWANGTTKRADGFSYDVTDFAADGTHHSPAGSEKVARHMLQFFKNDTTTKSWFVR